MTPLTSSTAPPRAVAAPHVAVAAPRAAEALAEVEAERAALSRLLHDDVLQSMLAARYTAELTGAAPEVVEAIRAAMDEARAAMWRLRPRTADGQLGEALAELAARRTGVVLAYRAEGVPARLDPGVATVAFRVVQAAHAACLGTTMEVRVELRGGVLTVTVCDDGESYESVAYEPGSELTRWLARAGSLGGRSRVGDGPTGGTTVWLEIPNALLNEVAE